ncbi:hypothetical protein YW7DRAFT_06614 [Streptomyces sp. AmelKG-E11A]|nr:hypothetical protein YW7DRAFT_06614 [Streptomyces sp. AmelKG-E11A]
MLVVGAFSVPRPAEGTSAPPRSSERPSHDEGEFLRFLLNLADCCGTSIQALATEYGTSVEDTLADLEDALQGAASSWTPPRARARGAGIPVRPTAVQGAAQFAVGLWRVSSLTALSPHHVIWTWSPPSSGLGIPVDTDTQKSVRHSSVKSLQNYASFRHGIGRHLRVRRPSLIPTSAA